MRHTTRKLLLVLVVCGVGLICTRFPVAAWSGATPVEISVLVVDGSTGRPIPGAEVEIIHSFDRERPPVKGRTAADGRSVLRNLFYSSGVGYIIGRTMHVTFRPFVIRVAGEGYSEYRAHLSPPLDMRYDMETTDPPLNLKYPVSEPVKIRMTRSIGGKTHGRSTESPPA